MWRTLSKLKTLMINTKLKYISSDPTSHLVSHSSDGCMGCPMFVFLAFYLFLFLKWCPATWKNKRKVQYLKHKDGALMQP